jgi:radial spoke head protein 4/6
MSNWEKLPDLSVKDLQAARNIKVMFTGDLNRPIFTNPFFFGQEKHYLRAQISRITHSTTLFPKGLKKLNEEDPRQIEDNTPEEGEIVMPSTPEMQDVAMWVHANEGILMSGKTTQPELEEAEDPESEEAQKKAADREPLEPLLKPLSADKSIVLSGGHAIPAWQARLCGDKTEFADPKNPKKSICNGVAMVRSNYWPGAYSFYYNAQVY